MLLQALDEQKLSAQWNKNGGEFIPHASTWLKGKRWEDQMAASYDAIPKGASGILGTAEMANIHRAMRENLPDIYTDDERKE